MRLKKEVNSDPIDKKKKALRFKKQYWSVIIGSMLVCAVVFIVGTVNRDHYRNNHNSNTTVASSDKTSEPTTRFKKIISITHDLEKLESLSSSAVINDYLNSFVCISNSRLASDLINVPDIHTFASILYDENEYARAYCKECNDALIVQSVGGTLFCVPTVIAFALWNNYIFFRLGDRKELE